MQKTADSKAAPDKIAPILKRSSRNFDPKDPTLKPLDHRIKIKPLCVPESEKAATVSGIKGPTTKAIAPQMKKVNAIAA